MSGNAEVEVEMFFHYETDKAVLMSPNNDRDYAVWLPKSQIKFDGKYVSEHTAAIGEHVIVTMPEWLAEAKDIDYW